MGYTEIHKVQFSSLSPQNMNIWREAITRKTSFAAVMVQLLWVKSKKRGEFTPQAPDSALRERMSREIRLEA